jgi:hypothetical protein
MSQQPESLFWKNLKKHLPNSWHVSRIENRFGGGIPDVYMCIDGKSLWIELKVTKNYKVSVSSHQIAWHFAHSKAKGESFFLVKTLSSSTLYLFDGVRGRGLAEHGLRVGVGDSGSSIRGSGSGFRDSGSSSTGQDSGNIVRDSGLSSVDQDSGSGFGMVVPCNWSGSGYPGLIEYLKNGPEPLGG